MSNPFRKILSGIFCAALFCIFFGSQPLLAQNWLVGGNPNLYGFQPLLGPTINQPLNIITRGIIRLHINDNSGNTRGFVGIGEIFTNPLSLLNVNGNATANATGKVFRTDGPANQRNIWELWTGTSQKGAVFVDPITANDFTIQSSMGGSRVLFNAGGSGTANRMMQISDGNSPGIGIGDYTTFTPRNFLHIHDGLRPVYAQFTNLSSQPAGSQPQATDGFIIGITNAGDAVLNQQENRPMWFNTGSATGSQPRMVITGGVNGFVGVGNYNNFTPSALLHVNADGLTTGQVFRTNADYAQGSYWDMRINGSPTGALYTPPYSDSDFHIQATNMLIFKSWGNFERMRITQTTSFPHWTRVAISLDPAHIVQTPRALLHLEGEWGSQGQGWRNWMNVGMYVTSGSDNMYVGLARMAGPNDRQDAIINWGDNAINSIGPDYLRFIFTARPTDNHPGADTNGVEIARMTPAGFMGIGPVFTDFLRPKRRLDIHHDGMTGSSYTGTPQLRLTQTQDFNVNLGVFTDFTTTNQGHLLINPFANNLAGRVGINLSILNPPTEALDVFGNGKFRQMPPSTNNLNVVLIEPDGTLKQRNYPLGIGADADFFDIGLTTAPQLNTTPAYREGRTGLGFLINSVAPGRMLEVLDKNPQLRLTETQGVNFTDFFTNSLGDLRVDPSGHHMLVDYGFGQTPVNIQTLDVNGNGRFVTLPDPINQAANTVNQIVVTLPDGTLQWRDASTLGGADNDWHDLASGGAPVIFGNSIFSSGSVGVGVNTGATLNAKFHTFNNNPNIYNAGYFHQDCSSFSSADLSGITGISNNVTYSGGLGYSDFIAGVRGIAIGNQNKLNVGVLAEANQGGNNYGFYSNVHGSIGNSTGIFADVLNSSNGNTIGGEYKVTGSSLVKGSLITVSGLSSIGVETHVAGANFAIGGLFVSAASSNYSHGINADATGPGDCRGGVFGAQSSGATQPTAGIYASVTGTHVNNKWAGFFNGDVGVTGVAIVGNLAVYSDTKFKENVTDISNALSLISNLMPHTYTYRTAEYPNFNFPTGTQFGMISQEVGAYLPTIVTTSSTLDKKDSLGNIIDPSVSFQALNYISLIPIAIKGIQELDAKINNLPTGGADTDWERISTGGSADGIYSGHTNTGGFNSKGVFIGLTPTDVIIPPSIGVKFAVFVPSGSTEHVAGAFSNAINHTTKGFGIFSTATGSGPINYGGNFQASGADNNYSGYFQTTGAGMSTNYGIKTIAKNARVNYGIWAETEVSTLSYAGNFIGNVNVQGDLYVSGTYPGSDSKLKENVQPITNAMNIITQLQPKTFNFKTTQFPRLNLPSGNQFGLIAQEVEAILPDLVKQVHLPQEFDSLGNVTVDSLNYRALNYTALVPVLLQGLKETNSQNTALGNTVDSLRNVIAGYETRFNNIEAMLNSCCQNQHHDEKSLNSTGNSNAMENTEIGSVIHITPDNTVNGKVTELYQNTPNPFTVKTTFTYSLGKTGFVELEIHSEVGQFIAKLVSEKQADGNYSIDWSTSDIAPGIYFYSLRVDGMLWVKKAVRIK